MTCRDLVRELERSPLVDSNELFDIATSFASGEEAVGAIFDDKKGKCMEDAPAEGSKSNEPQQKHKRGKKGKNPPATRARKGAMGRRPSRSTRPARALERPLEAPACLTTC
jgi:hypothetical protein